MVNIIGYIAGQRYIASAAAKDWFGEVRMKKLRFTPLDAVFLVIFILASVLVGSLLYPVVSLILGGL